MTSTEIARLEVGSRSEQLIVEDLPRVTMVNYAGVSGDYNPIHTDEVYAREISGHPTVFAHGMWTMGAVGRVVTDLVGDATLSSYNGRFVGQLWPGDDLMAAAEVVGLETTDGVKSVKVEVIARNQNGTTIFKGEAIAKSVV